MDKTGCEQTCFVHVLAIPIVHPRLCLKARDLPQSRPLPALAPVRRRRSVHTRFTMVVLRWASFVGMSSHPSSLHRRRPSILPPFVVIVFHPLVASPSPSSIRPSPSFPRPSALVASVPESIHLPPTSIPVRLCWVPYCWSGGAEHVWVLLKQLTTSHIGGKGSTTSGRRGSRPHPSVERSSARRG
ncbi:hypothetical protein BDN70DRAFT_694231 [Pholiota conissans]|uniref:Uncharacterized protein n=1 Tax=Pholiota conissans TaxID=109636 RepID=A0A9P5YKV5_9AGAR|nr:hypothetical protein BDN70DRAFT_694231 [Pholiota conissans]